MRIPPQILFRRWILDRLISLSEIRNGVFSKWLGLVSLFMHTNHLTLLFHQVMPPETSGDEGFVRVFRAQYVFIHVLRIQYVIIRVYVHSTYLFVSFVRSTYSFVSFVHNTYLFVSYVHSTYLFVFPWKLHILISCISILVLCIVGKYFFILKNENQKTWCKINILRVFIVDELQYVPKYLLIIIQLLQTVETKKIYQLWIPLKLSFYFFYKNHLLMWIPYFNM